VQWMTAGSGIMHQKCPRGRARGACTGFSSGQPAGVAQDDAAALSDVKAGDIPSVNRRRRDDGAGGVRRFWGVNGPVDGVATHPAYLDIWCRPAGRRCRSKPRGTRSLIFAGSNCLSGCVNAAGCRHRNGRPRGHAGPALAGNRSLVLFDQGDSITVQAGDRGSLPAGIVPRSRNRSRGTDRS
jgi:redox-sensitive bicupin YhaK (pirin superfamily)